ncbi:DUF3306 domain-containing protein [Ramlibacter tataouinensis]|nr:DUF3306 domain-containing protein [Ramlibacter tataouinensis]WBY03965.1 DUF3306 domain-containing protein [Ramlibacter tataouinensis]
MAEGFLGRWSRRKLDVKEGRAPEAEPAIEDLPPFRPVSNAESFPSLPEEGQREGAPVAASGPEAQMHQEHEAPPTLEDTHALTPQSDFTRFVRRDVSAEVKNAALKKLFADPHFNVMDGLDVYIDDYGKPDPLPESAIRQLASAQFLGLFREEEAEEKKKREDELRAEARDVAEDPPAASVAQCADGEAAEESREPPPPAGPDHGHADLRLQPDDAPGSPGPRPDPG